MHLTAALGTFSYRCRQLAISMLAAVASYMIRATTSLVGHQSATAMTKSAGMARMTWREVHMSVAAGRRNGNLPAEITSFVGRRAELAEVRRSVKSSRLVTITGMGGVGKTRLALRAASELSGRFPDGVWLAELSSATRPGVLAYVVANALALRDQTARRRAVVLAQQIADKRLLLVLDSCEHLVDACAVLAERLLRAAPKLHIIATSRQPFDISGEYVLGIEPFDTPGPDTGTDLPSLRRSDAVTLFAERASAVVPGFAVNQDNGTAVAALCSRLDGVPLAFELAAVRLRALSVQQLLHQLDDDRRPLGVGRRGGIARHRTMRAAIGWSHELCTPAERLAWARLSVFAGDFGLAAAAQMCGGPGIAAGSEFSLVESLVDKSILRVHRRGTEVRYRLLSAIREYGREWLSRLGEEERLRRLHRDWCIALACQGERDWFTGRQADALTRTEAEHASLQSALEFCFAMPGEQQIGLDLAATLWFYWVGCGHLGEGRYWIDRGLAAAAAEGPGGWPVETPGRLLREEPDQATATVRQTAPWARALWVNGYISIWQGDIASAVPMLEACREYATATADEPLLADASHVLGSAALIGGEHARAIALFTDALGRYAKLGEPNSIVIMASVGLAAARVFQGDLDAAVRLCAQIQRTCEASGEQWAYAYTRYVLALAAWVRRDAPAALANAQECLRIDRTFHDLVCVGLAVELIALLSAGGGDPFRAAILLGAVSRIWQSVGLPLFGCKYFNDLHDECVGRARAALTRHAFAAAFEHGAGLPLDRVVACALGEAAVSVPGRPALSHSEPSARDDAGVRSSARGPRREGRDTSGQTGTAVSRSGSFDRPGGAGRWADWQTGRRLTGQAGLPGPVPASPSARTDSLWGPLSPRECQVAALVADGLGNREISQRLGIAKRTADAHLEHILAKLTFTSRAQVAAWVTQRRSEEFEQFGDRGGERASVQPLLRPH
jgi:predicted ATPase/DNA-binding CsgD family transcriptional regulator